MSILRLFDVSQYIFSGEGNKVICSGVIEDQYGYRACKMPCGGIAYLMNVIYEYLHNDTDLVFCFDSIPSYKRELYKRLFPNGSGYKGNRPKKPEYITLQLQLAKEIIQQIGLSTFAIEGYEADDIIASLVRYYKNEYEKIIIHNNDSDMYYLVSDNVEIVPVNRIGKTVTLNNWETTVMPGNITPYNTITINKIIYGEAGDNIQYMIKEMADKIMKMIPKELYHKCGNHILLRKWVSNAVNDDERTMGIFDLVAPLIIPYEQVEIYETEFNKELYEYYASIVSCKYFKNYPYLVSDIGEETIRKYLEKYNETTQITRHFFS